MASKLILVAMDAERQAILSRFEHHPVILASPWSLPCDVCTTAGGRQFVVCRSSVGLVSAALSTFVVASHFPLECVLLLGVGGALQPELQLGDTVIGAAVVQHDAIFLSHDSEELMAPGELHLSLTKENRISPYFVADSTLVQMAKKAVSCACLGTTTHTGVIASGSSFVATPEGKRAVVKAIPRALMIEMEAAGVALCCKRISVPFLTIKTVADRFSPEQSIAEDYQLFLSAACENAARIAEEVAIQDLVDKGIAAEMDK